MDAFKISEQKIFIKRCFQTRKKDWNYWSSKNTKLRDELKELKDKYSDIGRPRVLTNAAVENIMWLYKQGYTYEQLAEKYIVSSRTICNVINKTGAYKDIVA